MPEPVVDVAWVRGHRDEVVLADVRWYLDGRSGLAAYLDGHIPGAIWVDLDTVLAAPPSVAGGRHPIPAAAEFAGALGELGVGDEDTVVAYDDSGGGYAARLVWLLRRIGRPAALLDGGLQAWPEDLEQGRVSRPPVSRTVIEWPTEVFRSADEVARATETASSIVLDARLPERYSGASVLPSDVRSGHIPGARNAPWAHNLTEDGTFAAPGQLRRQYFEQGVTPDSDVIVYCGSGVTACHDLLALELIGVRSATLYPGAWSAWSADPAREIAVGTEPDDPSTGNGRETNG
jgi:thiosulfate/3-mercaptopyruvate sulfurtransferase